MRSAMARGRGETRPGPGLQHPAVRRSAPLSSLTRMAAVRHPGVAGC